MQWISWAEPNDHWNAFTINLMILCSIIAPITTHKPTQSNIHIHHMVRFFLVPIRWNGQFSQNICDWFKSYIPFRILKVGQHKNITIVHRDIVKCAVYTHTHNIRFPHSKQQQSDSRAYEIQISIDKIIW